MHVTVDTGLCQAYGNCVAAAPEVFELDAASGLATVLMPEPPERLSAAVEQAVALCPTRAISVSAAGEGGG
jgi:ferredoxin